MITEHQVAIDIGGVPILLRTENAEFRELLAARYTGFVGRSCHPSFTLDVELVPPTPEMASDEDVQVGFSNGQWQLRRGDFQAQWDPLAKTGWVRQTPNPYSIDSVLRILHSLVLAKEGGFLLHAAGAIRNGSAFLFSGVSGAGKTTIASLAPSDVMLLTDEISYIRKTGEDYMACGTPFAGELARVGENCSARIKTVYLLAQGPQNKIQPVPVSEAARCLLRNILFFAEDRDLVELVFRSACEFVEKVPVRRLTFMPDEGVWDLIR
ncbi:MAG TPA: hypothetical protein VH437_09160 [Terriglobales bacterium]|jgi:hypothetical protein